MSKPEANYMWGNVDNTIQIIGSLIDLINGTTDLYDPNFCSPDNDGCSQQSSHNIGEFVLMRKQNCIQSGFKSQCKSINERISKLEVYLHSRKNKSKKFSPLQNEFLTPFKKITLKSNHFIFPMKNKDICDYDPRCIMSSGLMFDDIIMDNIKRNVSSHSNTAENDCVFTQIVSHIIYIYTGGHYKIFTGRKELMRV